MVGSPRFYAVICVSLLFGTGACANAAQREPAAPNSGELRTRPAELTQGSPPATRVAAEREANSPASMSVAPSPSSAANANSELPAAKSVEPARAMLDIEAHLSLLVASVDDARARLHERAAAHEGTVTSDVLRDEGSPRELTLTIRVPSGTSDEFLAEVERVGTVIARQVTAKDVGREFHDAEIVLHNLERTLARYEEILHNAHTVEEMLKIEAELSRIRGEIDRVKGELRYLQDRAARATVYLVLRERGQIVAESKPASAKFFPGARLVSLHEFRGERGTVSALGGGVAVGIGRAGNIELDALHRLGSTSHGPDIVLVTAGGDLYSDFLGGGQRRYLNPYLGLRAGYARITGSDYFACGGTIGVELFKSRYATIDTDLRVLGLFGESGSELGLEPTLGAIFAF